MRIRSYHCYYLGALLSACAALTAGCVTDSDADEATHAQDGGSGPTAGSGGSGTSQTGGSEEGGAGGAAPAGAGGEQPTAGAGGAEPAAAGAGGERPTAGAGGAEPTAGAGGAEPTAGAGGAEPAAGAGGAEPAAGAGGASAGAAGAACLGDTWSAEPDCGSLPGADLTCEGPGAGGAGGLGGAGGAAGATGYPPLGVEDCEWFVSHARRGFAEAYHACVAGVTETPCTEDYDNAVDECLVSVTERVCESADATTNCASIECSELEADECVNVLKIYPPDEQTEIVECFEQTSPGDEAGCRDAFLLCE